MDREAEVRTFTELPSDPTQAEGFLFSIVALLKKKLFLFLVLVLILSKLHNSIGHMIPSRAEMQLS
jgi:hypothetical protein